MDPFEFIMVLVSIIMGLGIATLLRGVVRSLRPDTTTTPGLVHAIWIVWVFVMPWAPGGGRWAIADRPIWTFWDLLSFLLVPILLFALAELAFPLGDTQTNLTDYLHEVGGRFFPVAATLMLAIVWSSISLVGSPLDHFLNPVVGTAGVVFLVLTWVANRRAHFAGAVLILLTTLIVYSQQLTIAAR